MISEVVGCDLRWWLLGLLDGLLPTSLIRLVHAVNSSNTTLHKVLISN